MHTQAVSEAIRDESPDVVDGFRKRFEEGRGGGPGSARGDGVVGFDLPAKGGWYAITNFSGRVQENNMRVLHSDDNGCINKDHLHEAYKFVKCYSRKCDDEVLMALLESRPIISCGDPPLPSDDVCKCGSTWASGMLRNDCKTWVLFGSHLGYAQVRARICGNGTCILNWTGVDDRIHRLTKEKAVGYEVLYNIEEQSDRGRNVSMDPKAFALRSVYTDRTTWHKQVLPFDGCPLNRIIDTEPGRLQYLEEWMRKALYAWLTSMDVPPFRPCPLCPEVEVTASAGKCPEGDRCVGVACCPLEHPGDKGVKRVKCCQPNKVQVNAVL